MADEQKKKFGEKFKKISTAELAFHIQDFVGAENVFPENFYKAVEAQGLMTELKQMSGFPPEALLKMLSPDGKNVYSRNHSPSPTSISYAKHYLGNLDFDTFKAHWKLKHPEATESSLHAAHDNFTKSFKGNSNKPAEAYIKFLDKAYGKKLDALIERLDTKDTKTIPISTILNEMNGLKILKPNDVNNDGILDLRDMSVSANNVPITATKKLDGVLIRTLIELGLNESQQAVVNSLKDSNKVAQVDKNKDGKVSFPEVVQSGFYAECSDNFEIPNCVVKAANKISAKTNSK